MSTINDVVSDDGHILTEEQWALFREQGYLHLGPVLSPESVSALAQRADDLALGVIRRDGVVVQRDTGGAYEELPSALPQGAQTDLLYRKINGLESDELFHELLTMPITREIFHHLYGRHVAMATFRAMIMNKPAEQGTVLPWHQDGGTVWQLDRDPLMTLWIALDDATASNGCVEALSGSHHLGLLSLHGSTVSDADIERVYRADNHRFLEVPSGHGLLIHNWLIHRSGVNVTPTPRRAFTACFLDARTRNLQTGGFFPLVDGGESETPHYFTVLQAAIEERTFAAAEAERYALSLRAALDAKENEVSEASSQRFSRRRSSTSPSTKEGPRR